VATAPRHAPIPGGSARAARVIAAVFACVVWLVPGATVHAEGPQPEPCTFLTAYSDAALTFQNEIVNTCEATFMIEGSQSLILLEVSQYLGANSVAVAQVAVNQVVEVGDLAPAPAYGEAGHGFEGELNVLAHTIVFSWQNYVANVGTSSHDAPVVAAARTAAASLNAAMKTGIGPPATTGSPGPTGPAGTLAPSASTGPFELGIGCAEDGVKLRCTASVSGQGPGADLMYQWTVDGVLQTSTTGTFEVDELAARIAEGDHVVTVTVTDQTTGATGSRSMTMHTSAKVFAVKFPYCTTAEDKTGFELRCTTSAVNPPPNAELVYFWNVDGAVSQGSESISKSVSQGIVFIAVSARDTISGSESVAATAQVVVNPTGIITNLLTGGQTSDPQNVVDEITGSALGAAALGAGAAIAGALGAMGGIATGGAGAAAPAGTGESTTATDPAAAKVGDAAGDLLGAESGDLPPPTPENAKAWKDLAGWPPGEVQDEVFSRTMNDAIANGFKGQALLDHVRAEAQALWGEMRR